MTGRYGFRRMTEADLPLLRQWLQTPDAAAWWGKLEDEMQNLAADLQEPGMRLWIVSLDDMPFAFLQDYDPRSWDQHPFSDLPPGTRGIDQTIGIPDMLGRGHGSALIAQHVQRLFGEGAPVVCTDPDPGNARAIRAYEKAGFTRFETRSTEWGECLLMLARPTP
jgi:aminoglycoside 6'-N-acetyltransferase